ncbi:hypothetical protein BS78_10G242400 [Paspalum vaginatum]|nr:hypothetical protein BS78_10G242400 [Paspalum vaginatum]
MRRRRILPHGLPPVAVPAPQRSRLPSPSPRCHGATGPASPRRGPCLHGSPRCRLPPLRQAAPPAVPAGPCLLSRPQRLPPPPPRKAAPPAACAGSAARVASPCHMGSPCGFPLPRPLAQGLCKPFKWVHCLNMAKPSSFKHLFVAAYHEVDKFLKNQRG